MPSTNENLGSNTAKLAEDPNHQSTLQSLISRSLGIGISFLGASSVVATTFNANLLPAAASTADYSGYTLDLDVRRSQKTNIDYPWNDENQNHVMGGEHGSRTVADLNPERDIPELGLTEGQGQKLVGLGFVRHSNFGNGGGFLYLNSKPYQAIVKPDGVERLCLVVKVNSEGVQTYQTFTSLDFDDVIGKCQKLNTLHNSGQEASHTPPVQIDLSNPKLQEITAHQDQAIQKILEVTEEYSKAGYLDKIGEQAGRLRALANKLENPASLRNLNITNSNVYGGVTGQSDYGTLGGANTNNYGEDLENMVLGPNPNSLSKSEVRMLGKRFQQELIKIQDALNYYITHPAAQNHTIRYLLANYLGQGGPVPEGIIGEGTNRGGEIAREEPRQLEERPRNNNNVEGLPCTASNLHPAIAKVTGILLAANLDQLQGSYNLKNSTDGELEALNCKPADFQRKNQGRLNVLTEIKDGNYSGIEGLQKDIAHDPVINPNKSGQYYNHAFKIVDAYEGFDTALRKIDNELNTTKKIEDLNILKQLYSDTLNAKRLFVNKLMESNITVQQMYEARDYVNQLNQENK